MQRWWSLPGPRRFSTQLAEEIRRGQNVILRVPEGQLRPLRRSLRSQMDFWQWKYLSPDPGECPFRLQDTIDHSSCRRYDQLAEAMLSSSKLDGVLFWLDISSAQDPSEWTEFLEVYAERFRHHASAEPLLIVTSEGETSHTNNWRSSQVNLSEQSWESNYFNATDARLLSDSVIQEEAMNTLKRNLAVEVVSRIALWDQRLAGRLSTLELKDLLQPMQLLKDYAQEQGWSEETRDCWAKGTGGRVFGEYHVHSALCALNGMNEKIERRIWAGEVAVLFPYLEACRRDLVDGLSDHLQESAEVKQGNQTVTVHRSEYELSEIHRQIRDRSDLGDELINTVRRLKDLRNDIAHHETMSLKHVRMSLNREETKRMIPE